MARSTMATLITRLRRAVGDPAGTSQTWTDDELQDFLDEHRVEARVVELRAVRSVATGGAVSYLEFRAPRGFWEDGAVLQSNAYATLVPTTSLPLQGRWLFATDQTPPVYASGAIFDLYGAAAQLLEAWVGKVARDFDFQTDEQRFARSQKAAGLSKLALEYRRRSRPPGMSLVEHQGAW